MKTKTMKFTIEEHESFRCHLYDIANEEVVRHYSDLLELVKAETGKKEEVIDKVFSGEMYGSERNLVCPTCGSEFTHIRRVYTRLGGDQYEAGVYTGTRPYGDAEYRRSALVVEVECESSGHGFAVVIQQHKGINLVVIEEIADMMRDEFRYKAHGL